MKIYNNLKIDNKHKNSVVAIGNFDGIHKGHQKVIAQAKKKANKKGLPFGIVTFEPVPVMFFNKKIKNHRINSVNQKKFYLEKHKLNFLIIVKFNKSFSKLKANDFIKKIIYEKIKSKYIFVSKNFKFGKNRKGNIYTLKKQEKIFGYKTIITSPLKKINKTISSTLIRNKISYGRIEEANSLLGRFWSIEGKVIRGKKRGRKIGFPTCNIKLDNYVVPKLGVYSIIAQSNKFRKKGIANVGLRPTFNGQNLLLEVNIFGLNENLYNKLLIVKFVKFLRPEKKFKNIIDLKKQIKIDVRKVK